MKKLLLMLPILAVLLFVGCSSDDENTNNNAIPTELIGTWNVETYYCTFTFNEDGTGQMVGQVVEEDNSKTRASWQMAKYNFTYSYVMALRQLTMKMEQGGTIVWNDLNILNGILTATDSDNNSITATKKNSGTGGSTTGTTMVNGHEAVDLGLSVKWATCNIGASAPEKFGDYYAFGEINTKSIYTTENSLTYGVLMKNLVSLGIINSYDPHNPLNNHLTSAFDAATAKWGEDWRIPTYDELRELSNECTWQWTTKDGVNGYKVIGKNGNSIFIPAGGYYYGDEDGSHFSSEQEGYSEYSGISGSTAWGNDDEGDSNGVISLMFTPTDRGVIGWDREEGMTIRPVTE